MSKLADSLLNQGLIGQEEVDIATAENYDDGAGGRFIDADTIDRDGTRYRLTGFDAREIDKFRKGKYQSGDVGGQEQTIAIAQLARDLGYTNLVPQGEPDIYGRTVADLQNKQGLSFGEELQAKGVLQPDQYTEQETLKRRSFGDLARMSRQARGESSEWDQAAAFIDEAIAEQSQYAPQFKQRAFDETELAEVRAYDQQHGTRYADQYTKAAVQTRSHDRNLDNTARNPLSESWDIGVRGVIEGATGMLELIGQETGWEGLEHWAEGQLHEQRFDLQKAPKVLTDFKEIDGVDTFLEYVGNMAALSLPYMVGTIGAAALAPATGGLSLIAPASVYGGQVWNEMGDYEDKDRNPALAISAGISMAVLDRLGIAGLANGSLLSKKGRDQIIAELGKKGVSKEAAEAQIVQATRLESAKYAGDASKFAKDMLEKQNLVRALLQSTAANATREGATEVAQESVAYLAAVAGGNKEYNPAEYLERIQHAAVGGFTLGGAFAIPGTAYDIGKWTDVAYRTAPADVTNQARQSRWREQEIREKGRVRSTQEIADEARAVGRIAPDLTQRTAEFTEQSKGRGIIDNISEGVEGIPGLWRGITRHIFSDEVQDKSPAARQLSSLFGGNLEALHSGATYESSKHLGLAKYKNFLPTPEQLAGKLGVTGLKIRKRKDMSDMFYKAYAVAKNPDGTANWDKLDGTEYAQHKETIREFARNLEEMTKDMRNDQIAAGADIGHINNYGFRVRGIDKAAVEKNPTEFKAELRERFEVTDAQAEALTDRLINGDDVNSFEDIFSIAEFGGLKPGAHRERSLNLSDDVEFASKWLSNDLFNNISTAAKSAARYSAYNKYVGEDNAVVNELFQQMEEELIEAGTPRDEARAITNKKAKMFKDYLDAESGNYKRPTTQLGKGLERVQKSIMFYTTLAGLPLATVSSFVEFALVYKGLGPGQVAEISKTTNEFAHAFWKDMKQVQGDQTPGRQLLRETGFFEWDVGAATVTGATEQKHSNQQMLDIFFTAIGLKSWTDYTRALRASFAMDYINDQMAIVEASNYSDGEFTNEQLEARENLSNIGININDFGKMWAKTNAGLQLTPEEKTAMTEALRLATFNWVNDAIVLPQSANRPLIYQNPQFALFTQFHGFISAFTANHLPKLYKQAFKGKTPSMKYNAFAVLTTMIALGFLSQYLKDLLKYGKTTPYLDDAEKVQRGLGASGLLGTGERVYNLFNPLYEQHYDTSIGKIFGELGGESAAITNLARAGEAGGSLLGGDGEQAFRKGAKLFPIVGPFNQVRDEIQDFIF